MIYAIWFVSGLVVGSVGGLALGVRVAMFLVIRKFKRGDFDERLKTPIDQWAERKP